MGQLPHDADFERCLLASMMCGADDPRIVPEHFHVEVHRDIFLAIREMQQASTPGESLDYVLLLGRLQSMTNAKWCLTAHDLLKLMESVPHACHVDYYADQVIELYERRLLVKLGRRVIERASDLRQPVSETLEKLAKYSVARTREFAERKRTQRGA